MNIEIKKPRFALARVAAMMDALADPSRLVLLQSLLEGPRCVEELAGRVALAASTVSFHLKKLEKAGLVSKTREQYYAVYAARTDDLGWTLGDLLSFDDPERKARAARADRMREQVRRAFLRGGRLVQMPVQQQKRRILLEEMAAVFPAGVPIPEKEVDSLLHRFHEDHCLLRRLLVDEGFLGRAAGTYWLIPRTGPPGQGIPAGLMLPGTSASSMIPGTSPGPGPGESGASDGGPGGAAGSRPSGLPVGEPSCPGDASAADPSQAPWVGTGPRRGSDQAATVSRVGTGPATTSGQAPPAPRGGTRSRAASDQTAPSPRHRPASRTAPDRASHSPPRPQRVPGPAAPPGRRKETTVMDRKRALKQAYKEMVIPAGVFQIRNLRNGRILLGGTMNLNAAFNSHRLQLNWGKHRNAALQKEWNECGESAFEFTILETISPPEDGRKITQDDVRDREKHWLKELQPYGDKGYHER